MTLVAAALVVSTLLHAGSPALAETTPLSSPSLSSPLDDRLGSERNGPHKPAAGSDARWIAPHAETIVWSEPGAAAQEIATAYRWTPLQVVGEAIDDLLPIWDPSAHRGGWIPVADVGPIDPAFVGTEYLPPVGLPVAWGGPARITMYTCVELGGCSATASGIWPEPGVVAVDPAVIPLGSTVWIQGLGTFLAADTGSLVRGAHLDVFGLSYADAIAWGVQERSVLVFARQ